MNLKPIIANPATFNREEKWAESVAYLTEWLTASSLEVPKFVNHHCGGNYGYYRSNRVTVHVDRTRLPVAKPGYSWSFTGYKADLTVPGVTAHEIGHHVQESFGWKYVNGLIAEARLREEANVSSYEPNPAELLAESVKVFLTNPELLRAGRPCRWFFLTTTLGLTPPHAEPWESVLQFADPRHIIAAKTWIRKGGVLKADASPAPHLP